MESWWLDLRAALRSLASNRATAALCIVCLGVGIGASTVVFSAVNALLLRPLPYAAPHRLVRIDEVRRGQQVQRSRVSYQNLVDWRERHGSSIGEMVGVRSRGATVSDDRGVAHVPAAYVSWNTFAVLGVAPALGRAFRSTDDRPGAAPVVVLSHGLWQRRHAGDPSIVGKTIAIDGTAHTVLGVMPPHFAFPRHEQLWLPLAPHEHGSPRSRRVLDVYARLADGATADQAGAQMAALAIELAREHPQANRGWSILVRPITTFLRPLHRALLAFMVGAVALVLLIACANAACLLLGIAVARQREMAVRGATGATRGRIVRQLLAESVLIGALSMPLGLAIAWLGIRQILLAVPAQGQPFGMSLGIDGRVLGFTMLLALATGLLFGLAPAWLAGRSSLHNVLAHDGGREATSDRAHRRLTSALVVGEVALAVVVLVNGGLFLRSFLNLMAIDGGIDVAPLVSLSIDLSGERYPTAEARLRRIDDLVSRLEAVAGVDAVAASDLHPLRGGGARDEAIGDAAAVRSADDHDASPTILYGAVTPRFFETLGVPILRGRSFDRTEASTRAAVAVINETMAETMWPGASPIGRRFRLGSEEPPTWYAVIGVARDVMTWDLSDRPWPTAYLPYLHAPSRNVSFVIRAPGDPRRAVEPAREAIRDADAGLPVFGVSSMRGIHRLAFWRQRILTGLFVAFGWIALLLAALGTYGVLSHAVRRRRREVGVRMALGAGTGDVVRLVVRRGMHLTLIGVTLGLAAALATTRVLRRALYELSPTDPVTFGTVALLLLTVGLLSCYLPARRAAATDPIATLRD